jgi:hypothetical protein
LVLPCSPDRSSVAKFIVCDILLPNRLVKLGLLRVRRVGDPSGDESWRSLETSEDLRGIRCVRRCFRSWLSFWFCCFITCSCTSWCLYKVIKQIMREYRTKYRVNVYRISNTIFDFHWILSLNYKGYKNPNVPSFFILSIIFSFNGFWSKEHSNKRLTKSTSLKISETCPNLLLCK